MNEHWNGENGIPRWASRRWPFVIGGDQAYRPPRWNSRLLLGWGVLEALLGVQPTALREVWKALPPERLATLMHTEGAGKEHPSRTFLASLVQEDERVLDVGCGAGANYEVLEAAGRAKYYVGVDSSEPSIQVARKLYPSGDFRAGSAMSLVSQFGTQSFDVVVLRHVLEHLSDFEPAMVQAISVSRRVALFVFFLTPRCLPFNVRKINPRIDPPFFTYIYSRPEIERYLSRSGLHWQWRQNLGPSRAGWLAGETNSLLIVSRNPL